MKEASERIPFLLACLLLAAPLSGESSTGRIRATATTTVRVSIPALYGISLLEGSAEAGESGGVVSASLADTQDGRLKFRLAVMTTMGGGSVALRRSLYVESPAGDPALLPAARGKSHDDVSRPAFFFSPAGAFGWKNLEERVGPLLSEPVSDNGNHRIVRVVYELWQF